MKIYVLLVRRSSTGFKDDSYIDSVFSSEEKAWNRIEEKIYPYFETVEKLGYKCRDIIIKNQKVIFEYENFIEDLYGSIRYEIHERVVK